MEVWRDNIKDLGTNDIFFRYIKQINYLYDSYNYKCIDRSKYYELVKYVIDETKTLYDGEVLYINYLFDSIKNYLVSYTKNILNDKNTSLKTISDFIDINGKIDLDKRSIEKFFIKLNDFFVSFDYDVDFDTLVDILYKNKTLNNIIKFYIDNNYEPYVLYNDLIKNCKEVYCMINNIDNDINNNLIVNDNVYDVDVVTSYLNGIKNMPLLTKEEEIDLAIKYKNGDISARKKLIESNLKLVVYISKMYLNSGMSYIDIIQEGNIGLIKAVEKFDEKKNCRFSTYAFYWIRQSILKALCNNSNIVRLPMRVYEETEYYKKMYDALSSKLNREPTLEEISKELCIPLERVKEYTKYQLKPISLNESFGDDESSTLENTIASDDISLDDYMSMSFMKSKVSKLFTDCNLSSKEKIVIMYRFGFNGEIKTLEETGKILNITRERVRQIEAKALMKIRRSESIKSLADYMDNPKEALNNLNYYVTNFYNNPSSKRSYTKKCKVSSDMPKNMLRKNIYTLLYNYSKEDIDNMFLDLTPEDMELFKKRYGDDLSISSNTVLNKEDSDKFYSYLLPKMKKILCKNKIKKSV